jgi:pilus assembly protein CpaE
MARTAQERMPFDDSDPAREAFAAYLTDPASLAAAQAFAARRGWPASSVRRGGLPAALRLLGVAPPPRLMIVDIEGLTEEEVDQGLTELARLGTALLVIGCVNDVRCFRRVLRSGARDYLVKPVDADALGEVFVRFEQGDEEGGLTGRLVGLIGARGGVGVTTLAINTAWIMAERLSRRTALVDMDIYTGTIALSLDMEPTRGLREIFDDPERVDAVFLRNAMTHFGKNLHVLGTEEALNDTVRLSDEKVLMLADTMRANFDMSVLDLPRHFIMREPALFSKLDDVVIVTELSLSGLRDVNRMMKLLALRNPEAALHVVANRVPARPEVSQKEFETGMEGPLRCVFPLDTKAMTRCGFGGQPLASLEPRHRMITALYSLCKQMAGVPEEPGRRFPLFSWRRRAA